MAEREGFILFTSITPKVEVEVPDFFETISVYTINWVRQIKDSYYEVAMKDSKHDGCTIWLCSISSGKVLPISSTLGFNEAESKRISLGSKLNLDNEAIHKDILLKRIEEYECLKNITTTTT